MKLPTVLTIALALSSYAPDATADEQYCTDADAIAAESEASKVQSWASLHQSFARFGHCDDGAIAEGYTESIVRLLVDKWLEIQNRPKLLTDDPGFQEFVIRHVNENMTKQSAEAILTNAEVDCSDELASFCGLVIRAVNGS